MKKIVPIIMLLTLAGCTFAQAPPAALAAPTDVSGVDVPLLMLERHTYVTPKDATNDAFFAAHSENKGVAKLQNFQMGLIEQMMHLSHDSGRKITLHESKSGVKN